MPKQRSHLETALVKVGDITSSLRWLDLRIENMEKMEKIKVFDVLAYSHVNLLPM